MNALSFLYYLQIDSVQGELSLRCIILCSVQEWIKCLINDHLKICINQFLKGKDPVTPKMSSKCHIKLCSHISKQPWNVTVVMLLQNRAHDYILNMSYERSNRMSFYFSAFYTYYFFLIISCQVLQLYLKHQENELQCLLLQ